MLRPNPGLPDTDPEVVREIDDWYHAMDASERIVFYKERIREPRWFGGALDATAGSEFDTALAGYRSALGLPPQGPLDRVFFGRFITQKVPRGPLDASTRAIQRIFPNRFVRDPRVEADALLALPGQVPFRLDAKQRIACIHARREVYNALPPPAALGRLRRHPPDRLRADSPAFAQSSGLPVALATAQPVPR